MTYYVWQGKQIEALTVNHFITHLTYTSHSTLYPANATSNCITFAAANPNNLRKVLCLFASKANK